MSKTELISDEQRKQVEDAIAVIQDFPKKGISFKDVMPIFYQPEILNLCLDFFAKAAEDCKATCICSPEARGFMFGCPLAARLRMKFVPARKSGKLPGDCYRQTYDLEYGTATIEIQKNAITSSDTVIIVDDLCATGGTAEAIRRLVCEEIGAPVAAAAFVINLENVYVPGTIKVPKIYSLCNLQG